MTIYDYYEPERYSQITCDCSKELLAHKNLNNPIDAFITLLDFTMDDEQFREDYPIDKNGCLFYLLCKYATSKENRKKIINMSHIDSFESKRNINHISSVLGDAEFELYLNNIIDIFLQYLETDAKDIKILNELYQGKLYKYCHYASAELCKNFDIVSAFVPSKFDSYRFLHSFLERDNTIYDVSNNLVMSKDDYYSLLTPEEVLKMDGGLLYKLSQSSPDKSVEHTYFDIVEKVLKKRR